MAIVRMQQRRGTESEWNSVKSTVILEDGEMGLESDTGRFKIGNGTSVWEDLPYFVSVIVKSSQEWADSSVSNDGANFIPELGQICFDSQSGYFKIGDGVTKYSSLKLFSDSSAIIGGAGEDFNTLKKLQDKALPSSGSPGQFLVKVTSTPYVSSWTSLSTANISDFNLTNPQNGQRIKYNSTSAKWEPFTPTNNLYVQSAEPTNASVGDLWFW